MFRIYTEDTNRDVILGILDSRFPAYTLLGAEGAWKGQRERSLVIEIANADRAQVTAAAQEIKTANKQQAVMVTYEPVEVALV